MSSARCHARVGGIGFIADVGDLGHLPRFQRAPQHVWGAGRWSDGACAPCIATMRRASPSQRLMLPNLASQSVTACASTTLNTAASSPREVEMACITSGVAACCSRDHLWHLDARSGPRPPHQNRKVSKWVFIFYSAPKRWRTSARYRWMSHKSANSRLWTKPASIEVICCCRLSIKALEAESRAPIGVPQFAHWTIASLRSSPIGVRNARSKLCPPHLAHVEATISVILPCGTAGRSFLRSPRKRRGMWSPSRNVVFRPSVGVPMTASGLGWAITRVAGPGGSASQIGLPQRASATISLVSTRDRCLARLRAGVARDTGSAQFAR